MSGSYANVLRNSRLAAMPQSIKSNSIHDLFPTSPSIRTTRANANAGDWGLKRTLPRLRTSNISVSAIDTQEHSTTFESSNRFTKVVERWQEMCIPVKRQIRPGPSTSPRRYLDAQDIVSALPENVGKGIYFGSMQSAALNKVVDKAHRSRAAFLSSQGKLPPAFSSAHLAELKKASQANLGIRSTTKRRYEVQHNAGLAYHPHGALSVVNTPEGPKERTLVGRVMTNTRNATYVGLGGILGELKQRGGGIANRSEGRANTIKVYAGECEVRENGALQITVDDARATQYDSQKSRGASPFLEMMAQDGEQGFADDDMEASETGTTRGRKSSPFMSSLDALLQSSPVSQIGEDNEDPFEEEDR